jgi:S1-C subfamily serine protease
MKKSRLFVAMLFALILQAVAQAEQSAEEVLRAVVKIRAVIPKEGRTAAVLGTEREGYGVLIDAQGHILTTGYLIIESEHIEVTGHDGKKFDASFVGYDHATGFGILRTHTPLNESPMRLGQSSILKKGDPVIVAGPGGPESVFGVRVMARGEFAGYWEYILEDAIYTSPPYANFGGAALIGSDGRLLGIGSLFTELHIQGIGKLPCNVFIPIDQLQPILGDLIAVGRPRQPARPWLGINAEETHGRIFVTRVTEGGPAEQSGLRPEDLIVTVNGKAVEGLADFYRKVWALGDAGVEVTLGILKGAEIKDVKIRSGDRNRFLMMGPKKSL